MACGHSWPAARGTTPLRAAELHVRPHMTIVTARIYYYPRTQARELKLTASHWGFADWFTRRLKPIREKLRGPEAKGVDIVNLMLYERPEHGWKRDEWIQRGNTFQFTYVCDLRPLEQRPSIENIPQADEVLCRACESSAMATGSGRR